MTRKVPKSRKGMIPLAVSWALVAYAWYPIPTEEQLLRMLCRNKSGSSPDSGTTLSGKPHQPTFQDPP